MAPLTFCAGVICGSPLIQWLEAIVWNVRGASDVKSPQLVSEARFIQGALGRGDKAVWKRVLVVVNMSLAKGGGCQINMTSPNS